MARRTKEEALETRCRILDTAEQVFSEKGVARTSLAGIAAEVVGGFIAARFARFAARAASQLSALRRGSPCGETRVGLRHLAHRQHSLRARADAQRAQHGGHVVLDGLHRQ